MSKARTATSSASVESSPPLMPMVDVLRTGVPQALGQAGRLDGEDLLAVRGRARSGFDGTNGSRATGAGRRSTAVAGAVEPTARRPDGPARPAPRRSSSCRAARGAAGRRRCRRSRSCVSNRNRSVSARIAAVLGDQRMTAEDDVHRALARARPGVDVRGEAAGRLLADELAAVRGLAEQLRAAARVDDDRRPGERQRAARRLDRPQVLADLDADARAPGQLSSGKTRSVPNGTPSLLGWAGWRRGPGRTSGPRRTRAGSAGTAWARCRAPRRRATTAAVL